VCVGGCGGGVGGGVGCSGGGGAREGEWVNKAKQWCVSFFTSSTLCRHGTCGTLRWILAKVTCKDMTQDTPILQLNRRAMIYIYVYNYMCVYTYGYVFITWPAIHACTWEHNTDWCSHTHIHNPNEQINSTNTHPILSSTICTYVCVYF